MARFRRVGPDRHEDGSLIREYRLDLRPGHTIRRIDSETRLAAGRKGRAASVDIHRTLTCSCGGELAYGGLTVTEDLLNLRHFESPEERDAYEAEQERHKAAVLRSLGLPASG